MFASPVKHTKHMIPPDLVPHIVSFLNGDERRAVGYDVATCVRLKLPPAPLSVAPAFQTKLTELQERREGVNGVLVYSEKDAQIVLVDFVRDGKLSDYTASLIPRLVMFVYTNITLDHNARPNGSFISFIPNYGDAVFERSYCWIHNSLRAAREAPAWISCKFPLNRMRQHVVFQ